MNTVEHYLYFDNVKLHVSKDLFKLVIDSVKSNNFLIRPFDDGLVTEYWLCTPLNSNSVGLPFPPKDCSLIGYTILQD